MDDHIKSMIGEGRDLVPDYMWPSVERYFVDRIEPGNFLSALLSNDLMGAIGAADDTNQENIVNWCKFLYNYAPSGSYGLPENFRNWLGK